MNVEVFDFDCERCVFVVCFGVGVFDCDFDVVIEVFGYVVGDVLVGVVVGGMVVFVGSVFLVDLVLFDVESIVW